MNVSVAHGTSTASLGLSWYSEDDSSGGFSAQTAAVASHGDSHTRSSECKEIT